jgi:hypothetical protein
VARRSTAEPQTIEWTTLTPQDTAESDPEQPANVIPFRHPQRDQRMLHEFMRLCNERVGFDGLPLELRPWWANRY